MPKTTLTFSIPSLQVDSGFLKRLGTIIESEALDRKRRAESRVREIESELANGNLTAEQKSERSFELGRAQNHRNADVNYTFGSKYEEISFSSAAEIESTLLMPNDIKSLVVRVWHFNNNYVDIHLRFRDPFGLGEAELSSANETALRAMRARLDALFAASRPGYHSLMMMGQRPNLIRGSLGFGLAVCVSFLAFKYFLLPHVPVKDRVGFAIAMAPTPVLILTFAGASIFRYLYPIYEFSLGMHDGSRVLYRKYAWVVLGGLILSIIAGLIQSSLT